jgi:uncharacterized RDD family membrane protein YckC
MNISNRKLPDFDLMKVAGLKRKKKPVPKYATINQRMVAASIDSFIILIVFAPLIDLVVLHYFPIHDFNLLQVQSQLGENPPPSATIKAFFHASVESGAFRRWWINSLAQFVVYFTMSAICWKYWSATPGKMVMRQTVVDAKTEAPISDARIAVRIVGYCVIIASCMIGFFWAGFDKRHQGWHDKMAGTVVLNSPLKRDDWEKLYQRLKQVFRVGNRSDSPAP